MVQSSHINVIALLYFAGFKHPAFSEFFDSKNATKLFQYFQWRYRPHYENDDETDRSYLNFITNLNTVSRLNEELGDTSNMYALNKYADKDPEELREQNGVKIMPYELKGDPPKILRNQNDEADTDVGAQLYDIDDAYDLYEQYKKQYNKETPKKKKDRYIRYLRFVKTLTELNTDRLNGEKVMLNDQADIVKEPNAFIYE